MRTSVDAREAKIQPNRRKVLTRIIYIPGGSRGYPSRYLKISGFHRALSVQKQKAVLNIHTPH